MLARTSFVAAIAAAAGLAAPAIADTPQPLRGETGPGFDISLHDATGADVKAIDVAGAYTFVIEDKSELHNFHLVGPGVDVSTGVDQIGTVTWPLNLQNGTYRYFCDPHNTIMRGSFTVGAVTTPPPPPQPKPKPSLQKLAARVGPGAKVAFAARAKAGRTQITVRDLSTTDNFHLTGPGLNKKTGVKFRGTVTWTVTLKRGTYAFRSDAHAKLKGKTKVG